MTASLVADLLRVGLGVAIAACVLVLLWMVMGS